MKTTFGLSATCRNMSCKSAAAAVLLVVASSRASAADFMFRADVNGQTLEGKPLTWTPNQMMMLGRDGRLYDFDPREAKNGAKTGSRFIPFSMPEMKRELYREFGQTLDISTTQHYIVVHPRGSKDNWADRFEELYRSCLQYIRVRGFTPQEPEFPMVAIVYRNQADYFAAASASGTPMRPGTLGHYDPTSNRVFLFDTTGGKDSGDWSQNADTIIHEATHQTAFNVGIHTRFTEMPRWLVEGLATMFEARGVWNSSSYHLLKDRINAGRLHDFKDYAATRRQPGSIARLITSDQAFRSDPLGAYAEAWALSFYLCETRPREYVEYLEKTASRPIFAKYSDLERMADFQQAFGDWKQIEANFLTWMADVK
jgi:Protein of unknown function (DUF1570)